jgi:hypothetical protein
MKTRKSPSGGFRQILERFSHFHDRYRVFDAFTRFVACALAAQTREAEYLEETKRWEKPEMDLFTEAFAALILEMERRPFEDLIGSYYMEVALSKKGQKWNGEFHTPKHVCDFMARITVGNMESFPAEGPITICEPACGSGAMILSLAQVCSPEIRRRLRVTAIDINRIACDMTFINTTLWGVPTRVFHGNTLSSEFWAAWSNVHWLMPWLSLVLMHPLAAMHPPSPKTDIEQGAPPKPDEVQQIVGSLQQTQLAL